MPNGESKNWIRFLASLEGFYATYGDWPVRMFVSPEFIEDLNKVMEPEDFNRLQTKLELIPESKATFLSEDDQGRSYDYGKQGVVSEQTKPNAIVRHSVLFPVLFRTSSTECRIEWLEVTWPNYEV